jgi:hypothetical protein
MLIGGRVGIGVPVPIDRHLDRSEARHWPKSDHVRPIDDPRRVELHEEDPVGRRCQHCEGGPDEDAVAALSRQAHRREHGGVVIHPTLRQAPLGRDLLDGEARHGSQAGRNVDVSRRLPELGKCEVGTADDDELLVRLPACFELVVEGFEGGEHPLAIEEDLAGHARQLARHRFFAPSIRFLDKN